MSLNPKLNLSWTMRQIRYFGRLYDLSDDYEHEMTEFQDILDQTDTLDGGLYDVQYRMKEVCAILTLYPLTLYLDHVYSLLPSAKTFCWSASGRARICHVSASFRPDWPWKATVARSTMCVRDRRCLFPCKLWACFELEFLNNCVSSWIRQKEPLRTCHTGATYGLVVVVNTSIADYFYPTKNSAGFSISINSPTEFPDETSGHFQRIVLPSRTEAFVMLDVRTVKAEPEVANYTPQQVTETFKSSLFKILITTFK